MRSWDVTIDYIVGEHLSEPDEVEVSRHRVQAATAQSALRVLVLTSTENARVVRIEVSEVTE
jgi:hypothetical protein